MTVVVVGNERQSHPFQYLYTTIYMHTESGKAIMGIFTVQVSASESIERRHRKTGVSTNEVRRRRPQFERVRFTERENHLPIIIVITRCVYCLLADDVLVKRLIWSGLCAGRCLETSAGVWRFDYRKWH